jgi:DNA-binding response OmpR family regulator
MPNLILIVEDDPAARQLMDRFFRREGFLTALAGDGADGLALAVARPPDLIVLDLAMPRLDGLRLLRMFRVIDTLRDVPVIVTTSRSEEEIVGEALSRGADQYLVKTRYSLKDLSAIVRRHLPPARGAA